MTFPPWALPAQVGPRCAPGRCQGQGHPPQASPPARPAVAGLRSKRRCGAWKAGSKRPRIRRPTAKRGRPGTDRACWGKRSVRHVAPSPLRHGPELRPLMHRNSPTRRGAVNSKLQFGGSGDPFEFAIRALAYACARRNLHEVIDHHDRFLCLVFRVSIRIRILYSSMFSKSIGGLVRFCVSRAGGLAGVNHLHEAIDRHDRVFVLSFWCPYGYGCCIFACMDSQSQGRIQMLSGMAPD